VLFNAVQLVLLVVFLGGLVLTLGEGWIFQLTFSILIAMQVAIMAIRSQFAYQQRNGSARR